MYTTTLELLEIIFSMQSVPKPYHEDQRDMAMTHWTQNRKGLCWWGPAAIYLNLAKASSNILD
jgi:hypothetical protein